MVGRTLKMTSQQSRQSLTFWLSLTIQWSMSYVAIPAVRGEIIS